VGEKNEGVGRERAGEGEGGVSWSINILCVISWHMPIWQSGVGIGVGRTCHGLKA